MQIIHSFNHSAALGMQENFGLFQLLAGKGEAQETLRPGVSWFEQAVLVKGLGAKDVWVADPRRDGALIGRIADLSAKAGIPPPRKLLIYDSPNSNASVILNGSMAISTGMLRSRPPEAELNAVIAHELSHLKRMRSNIVLNVAAIAIDCAVSAAVYIKTSNFKWERGFWKNAGRGILLLPVAWLTYKATKYLTKILLTAHARHNEMVADRESAELTRDPAAMVKVLQRIEDEREARRSSIAAERLGHAPQQEQPEPGIWQTIKAGLERNHPPTHKRLAQLYAMEQEMQPKNWEKRQPADRAPSAYPARA